MSEQELKEYDKLLNDGLKASYEKMLQLKMRLGQDIVTSDENGNPVIMSAEEAWCRYQQKATPDNSPDGSKVEG